MLIKYLDKLGSLCSVTGIIELEGAQLIWLPRLTEISVTRTSEHTVRFVFSRFRFGSVLYFFKYKRC